MQTILEVSNITELGNTPASSAIIPAGNKCDIQIGVSGWWLITQGKTLNQVATFAGWSDALQSAGLRIDSTECSLFATNIIYHCTALKNIVVSSITLGGTNTTKVLEAGTNWLAVALVAGITLLGITAGIRDIKISADTTQNTTTKADLTQKLADAGYSASEISDILNNVNTKSEDQTGLSGYLDKIFAIVIVLVLGYLIYLFIARR